MSHTQIHAVDFPRLHCAREALHMVEYDTQKLWMKFALSLCLVYFVIEHGAESSYIGLMITVMWTEVGEFAKTYREVRKARES